MLEVGLCVVNTEILPQEWNIAACDIPVLGASPDGLLLHPLHTTDNQSDMATSKCKQEIEECLAEVVEVKTLCPFVQSDTGTKHHRYELPAESLQFPSATVCRFMNTWV